MKAILTNKFGIPEKELSKIYKRDKNCAYCHKKLKYPYDPKDRNNSATIEHLNFDGPFYWNKGLKIEDIVICCGQCNSSRGIKKLSDWFKADYCQKKNINEKTVSEPVKKYISKRR